MTKMDSRSSGNKMHTLIIDENDIKQYMNKLGLSKYRERINLRKLKQRNLIPLHYNHEKLPYILKILGFTFGDASLNFIGKRRDGILGISSKNPKDLEKIREDIIKIGYTPGKIYKRREGRYITYKVYVNATSLLVLLHALGAPIGDKTLQKYRVPQWIFKCTPEQKRLFLAAFFGAELSKPEPRKEKPTLFASPQLEMAKELSIENSAKEFLEDIAQLLREFEIESVIYRRRRIYTRKKDGRKTIRYILSVKSTPENLINLWEKIGYEYNEERQKLAKYAVAYLRYKISLLERRRKLAEEVKKLAILGLQPAQIKKMLRVGKNDERFVEEICYKVSRNIPISEIRTPRNIMNFTEFMKQHNKK